MQKIHVQTRPYFRGSEGFTKIDGDGNKIVLPAIADDAARAWHLHYVLAESPEACRGQAARHRAMVAQADRFHRLCTGGGVRVKVVMV